MNRCKVPSDQRESVIYMYYGNKTRFCFWLIWVCNALVAIGLRPCVVGLYMNVTSVPFTLKWWWLLLPWAVVLITGTDYFLKNPEHNSSMYRQVVYATGVLLAVIYLFLTFLPLCVTVSVGERCVVLQSQMGHLGAPENSK